MARPRNPLSPRNRNRSFTGAELAQLAKSKRAQIIREKSEFDPASMRSIVRSPFIPPAAFSWSIDQIVSARDSQLVGRFRMPARLAESMGTDDALFTARGVRLAPVQSLGVEIEAGKAGKGDSIACEAEALFGEQGVSISADTITTIRSHLADHGVAFACINWTARADGSRVDPVVTAWPIEFVWWHAIANCYYTQVRRLDHEEDPTAGNGLYLPGSAQGWQPLEPIIHGNGRWIVFQKSELLPHRLDAAILPAALVWARHAFAMRDWAKGSAAHGNAKVVGELPENTALSDAEGELTAEAAAFLALLQGIASQDEPVGIQPAGSKVSYLTNTSKAWEVWVQLADRAEKAAARIYLGTDGILGAQGGAPGVDLQSLFGVATGKIQSDLACIERGSQTGLIAPWCAVNFGDSKLMPMRRYVFPDPDAAAVRADFAARNKAFLDEMAQYRVCGFTVDQALVNQIAKAHGVPVPQLPEVPVAPATAPTGEVGPVGPQ